MVIWLFAPVNTAPSAGEVRTRAHSAWTCGARKRIGSSRRKKKILTFFMVFIGGLFYFSGRRMTVLAALLCPLVVFVTMAGRNNSHEELPDVVRVRMLLFLSKVNDT